MASPNRVIATAGLIAVAVGSINAIAKNQKLPSARFLIGSGVAFLIISAMADAEPELAQAFAIAICTTVVLGDGGGVLSYINNGEMDTAKGKGGKFTPDAPSPNHPQPPTQATPTGLRPSIVAPSLTPRPNIG